MDRSIIAAIVRHEVIITIRSRWLGIFALAFGALALAISYFGLVTGGMVGFQGFSRTSASLLNLVLYVIPLVAVIMGTLSFTSEKSTGELLFSQPVTRTEILVGKLLGLYLSLVSATLLGFGSAGLVIALKTSGEGAERYPLVVGLALVLELVFLCLAALTATLCQRKSKAVGVALFLWFFFVIFYDLLVIGGTFLLRERTANIFLFLSLFGNPVDMIRVASLIALNGKEIFGAAGAALIRFVGGSGALIALMTALLVVWIAAPIIAADRLLRQQDI
jgi:Cu-processing system permease protein